MRLRFSKEGYREVAVDQVWPSIRMFQVPEGETFGEEDVDGAIVVPLERETDIKPDQLTEP